MSIDPRLLLLRARAMGVLADIEKAAKKGGKFDSAKHPRYPAGNPKGGQFRPKLGTGAGGQEIFMPVYTGSNKIIQAFEAATLAVANQMAQGILTGAQKLMGIKTHPDDTNNLKLKSTVRQLAAGVAKPDAMSDAYPAKNTASVVTPPPDLKAPPEAATVKPATIATPATAAHAAVPSIKTSDQVAALGAAAATPATTPKPVVDAGKMSANKLISLAAQYGVTIVPPSPYQSLASQKENIKNQMKEAGFSFGGSGMNEKASFASALNNPDLIAGVAKPDAATAALTTDVVQPAVTPSAVTPKPASAATTGYQVKLLPETSSMNKLINAEMIKVQELVDSGDTLGLNSLLATAKHSETIKAIADAKEYLTTGKVTPAAPPPAKSAVAIGNAPVISAPKGIGSKTHAQYTKQADAVYQSALVGNKPYVDAMVAQYQAKIDTAKLKPNYPTFADGQYNKLLAYSQKVQAEMQTAATAGLPAATPKAALTKTKLALADMTQVGGKPGGSNPGGIYQDADGAKWLVKGSNQPDPDGGPAKNEVLAARLYNAAGGHAPEMRTVDMGTQYGGGIGVASKMQDGFQPLDVNNPAHVAKAREDFALDAWMANWDSVGLSMDNTVIDQNGNALRIDPGGALLYRAQGEPKGAAFGKTVGEWNSLRDPSNNPQAAKVFAGMTDSELKASAAKVAAISDSTITALVNRFGPGDAAAKADLVETLIARKQDVIAQAGLLGATGTVKPDTTADSDDLLGLFATLPTPVKPDTSALTLAQKAIFDVIDNAVNKVGDYNVLSDQDVQVVLGVFANSTDFTSSPELKQYAQAWSNHLKAGATATATATVKPAAAPTIKTSLPDFNSYKLEASNVNAPGINKKVDHIAAMAQAGNVDGILAMSFGSSNYAKKTVKLANDTLAALGSTATVVISQKANSHPLIGTAGTAPVAQTPPVKPAKATPTAQTPAQTLIADINALAAKFDGNTMDGGIGALKLLLDDYSSSNPEMVAGMIGAAAAKNSFYSPEVQLLAKKAIQVGIPNLISAWTGKDLPTPTAATATAKPAATATHTGTWANQYGSGVGDLTTRVTALGAATAAKAALDIAKLEPPKDYANLNGPGQGLSTQPAKNAVTNQIAQDLYVLATQGDLDALKTYDIPAKVGGVKNTKTEEVVGAYRDLLIGQIENMLNPPPPVQTWKIGGPVTPKSVTQTLQQAFPKYQQYQQVFQDKANMLGRWGVQGGLDQKSFQKVVAAVDKIPDKTFKFSSPGLQKLYDASYVSFNKLLPEEQEAIKNYTGGVYTVWNTQIATNQLGSDVKIGMRAYEKASVELPPGLILSRKWDPPDHLESQINKGLMDLTGKVVQDVAMISSSIDPTVWSGTVRMRIKTLPGARGIYLSKTSRSSDYIGNYPDEKEIVFNSKTRFLVTKVSKTNYDKKFFEPGGEIFMDILALPEDPTGSVLDSTGVK